MCIDCSIVSQITRTDTALMTCLKGCIVTHLVCLPLFAGAIHTLAESGWLISLTLSQEGIERDLFVLWLCHKLPVSLWYVL